MQIKLVNTITKWLYIWPLGVELKLYFSDRRAGWKYLGFNFNVHSWKGTVLVLIWRFHFTQQLCWCNIKQRNALTDINTSAAWAHNTSKSQHICSSFKKLGLILQMIVLIKVLRYSAGVSLEWNVSLSLDPWSDFHPGRGRVVMPALTVEI